MVTLLLIVVYIAFIGLGIPDSVFGTAWPLLYRDLGIPVSFGGFVSMTTCVCTIISSLFSARLIRRFGTGKVTAVSTAMTAFALLGFSFSQNVVWLFALALPLGFGAGAIDSGLNNFVALHFDGRVMNFLHCFYGVGIALSPYLMSFPLKNGDWRGGYRLAFVVQISITVVTIAALPLWKKFGDSDESGGGEQKSLSLRQIISLRGIAFSALAFTFSCAVEGICNQWANTFLVDSRGLSPDFAARTVTFYYVGMALGRFLSGVAAKKFSSWQIVGAGCAVFIPAALLLNFATVDVLVGLGLFCVGLGNGPVFPNLVHLTPQSFGAENSQAVMGAQLAAAYAGSMVFPPLFGATLGVGFFTVSLSVLFCLIVAMTVMYRLSIVKK